MRNALFILLFASTAVAQVPGDSFQDCDECPEVVVIPAGDFLMGTQVGGYEVVPDSGEAPPLQVSIRKAFAIGKTEVTRAEFEVFLDDTDHELANRCVGWDDGWAPRDGKDFTDPPHPNRPRDDHPANCVTHGDAEAYVAWLSEKTGEAYRLPSESEWEYAARAGTTAPRYWGMNSFEGVSISLACDNANVFDITGQETYPFSWVYARCDDGHADVAPVASYPPNPFGLHDMIGNLYEWTSDCHTGSYWGRPADERPWVWEGGCGRKVIRGGSWIVRPVHARAAWRVGAVATNATSFTGFRVVREIEQPKVVRPAEIRRVTIITADVERAKKFWTEGLGYQISFERKGFGGENMRRNLNLEEGASAHFVTMSPSEDGGVMIGLIGVDGQDLVALDKPRDEAPRTGDHYLVIRVGDAAHAYEVAEEMGMDMIREPEELGSATGVAGLEFALWGPDGTRLLIQELRD